MTSGDTGESQKVLVVFMFDGQLGQLFRNRCIVQKNVINNYGNGKPLGYAEEMLILDGFWRQNLVMGLIQFDSDAAASKWIQSDPQFRQMDWLDDHDVWLVPMKTDFSGSPSTYQCIEFGLFKTSDPAAFEDQYLEKWKEAVTQAHAIPCICSTSKVKIWRGLHDVDYITITQWPNECIADTWYKSEEAAQIKALRSSIASGSILAARMKYI
ncbi:unnamed protein product [Calicophoron daubneyi]|uniref:Uncharacterized protein n=1 Tax=Calicophoron daubneyi TaxID=300641 RepID=A0AAV2TVH4_CALDB